MSEWWESLTAVQRFFLYCGVPASVILMLQTVLLVFDMGDAPADGDGDVPDGDLDGMDPDAGLRIFTIRGFVTFFSIFGWLGLTLTQLKLPNAVSVVLAFCGGSLAMVGVAVLIRGILKLQTSGNIDNKNAIGKTATVYMSIPAKRKGAGKVTVLVQESLQEIEAVTDHETPLKTGTSVVVVAVNNQSMLVVEPLS